jgi:bifunctional ADP-heptose synthase (sugar kinase/adenylyltransferase)
MMTRENHFLHLRHIADVSGAGDTVISAALIYSITKDDADGRNCKSAEIGLRRSARLVINKDRLLKMRMLLHRG